MISHQGKGSQERAGRYYRLSAFFKEHFGCPVYKVPLHCGFTCPNRDGTIGTGGCTFCSNLSFSPFSAKGAPVSITGQLAAGRKKKQPALYMAYFQSYTNTYASFAKLKALYDEALAAPDIVGLSIATRPDCVNEEILSLLEGYAKTHQVWIEYGLQSAHPETLEKINRGHDAASFEKAVLKTCKRGIYTCAHIILGLPGEQQSHYFQTISFINRLKIDGIKFHHLQVIKDTPLARQFAEQKFYVYNSAAEYIKTLCDCLERLSPSIVVQRLAGQATSKELLVAPHWTESSGQIAAMTEKELACRSSRQGQLFGL